MSIFSFFSLSINNPRSEVENGNCVNLFSYLNTVYAFKNYISCDLWNTAFSMNQMNIINDSPIFLLCKCKVKPSIFCVIQVGFDLKDIEVKFSKRTQEP